jgi:hypothetical protein
VTTAWTIEADLPGRGHALVDIDQGLEDCDFALEDAYTPAATTWTQETYI